MTTHALEKIVALVVGALTALLPAVPGAAPATPAPPSSAAVPSVEQPFDLRTFDGRWLVPEVGGGLVLVDDLAESPLPTSWVLDGSTGRIAATATVDGRALCLTASTVDHGLALDLCGDDPTGQSFDVVVLDRAGEVGIGSANGLLTTTPDGVQTGGSPDSPATVFHLV